MQPVKKNISGYGSQKISYFCPIQWSFRMILSIKNTLEIAANLINTIYLTTINQ